MFMKKQLLQNKYPVYSFEIEKDKCLEKNTKNILQFFKEKINQHPVAKFIAIFDHFSHTKGLKNGEISTDIKNAQIIIFCFGKKLENSLQLAVRPRAIGVAELKEKYIISFLEAPNPAFNKIIKDWIKSLIKK